jgi:hypothetical protein
MFDRVEQDFPESCDERLFFRNGTVVSQLGHKTHEAFGVHSAWCDPERDPVVACRQDFDTVLPITLFKRAVDHCNDFASIIWRAETGEDVGAQGRDQVIRRGFRGQQNQS